MGNHESGIQAGIVGQESRQVSVLGIQEPLDPALGDVGQHRKSNRHEIEGESQRLSMKVPARNHILRISEDERVVGCAVQFHGSHAPHILQAFSNRTMYLRYATEAIGILHASTIEVRLANLALMEESRQTRRNFDLAWVGSRPMNALVEGLRRPFQCFQRHGARQIRQIQQLPGAPAADESGCQRGLRSVQECEPFLGLKLERFQTDRLESLAPGDLSGLAEDFTFSDQNQRQMGHRSEISTGAHAASTRNDRIEMMIQQLA